MGLFNPIMNQSGKKVSPMSKLNVDTQSIVNQGYSPFKAF